MNAKTVKAIRHALGVSGFDFREAKYKKTKEHHVTSPALYSNGEIVEVQTSTTAHTAVLHHCGRQLYKQLKKVAA